MTMYFIFDADGNPFGNPKGYAKHPKALGICTRYRGKLWQIYDEGFLKRLDHSNLIYKILLLP